MPEVLSLQTVASRAGSSTGSGSTVSVTVTISPSQGAALTGIISYSTVRLPAVVFVKTSLTIAFASCPSPVEALPPPATRPPATRISSILKDTAGIDIPSSSSVIPEVLSLHTVASRAGSSTGKGFIVKS